jgi:hypothetical protein
MSQDWFLPFGLCHNFFLCALPISFVENNYVTCKFSEVVILNSPSMNIMKPWLEEGTSHKFPVEFSTNISQIINKSICL